MSGHGAEKDARCFRYADGETSIDLWVPWGDGTGWIPPGHIDFAMTVTHETRRFVYVTDLRPGSVIPPATGEPDGATS